MATVNFSDNKEFQEQVVEFLAEFKEKLSPDDCAKIDACTDVIGKQIAPDPEPEIQTGIKNSEFRIINDIISQNVNRACSQIETTVIQQAERLGYLSTQQFQYHGNGICTFISKNLEETCGLINRVESIVSSHEFFHNQITDQIRELNEEVKQLKTTLSFSVPMDLPRESTPSPDQDFNGCLDGNRNEIRNKQAKVSKETKEDTNPDDAEASSTLNNKANDGDMNKQRRKKSAPNAEQIPGSPENAKIKNGGMNGIKSIEKNDFWAVTQKLKSYTPILVKDPNTGKEGVNYEIQEYEAKDNFNYNPSKSAKKRMRKRRLEDAARAKCEVIVHGLEETIDKDDIELFWFSEAKTFIKFTEELSPIHLEKDGIEIALEDIAVTSRILVWGDNSGPLPMVVKFKDEEKANSVLKAMYAAGCYKRRIHVNRGKYKKTGDKATDKKNEEEFKKLKGCFGRPSTTKAERDAAKKKKEYLESQHFHKKKTFHEIKQERVVNYTEISAKYAIDSSKGSKDLIKKPKTSSKKNTEENYNKTGNEADKTGEKQIKDFNPLNYTWFIGDYVRVKCNFDGLVHEAKIKKLYRLNQDTYRVVVLGYGVWEDHHVNTFGQSRGYKARIAQANDHEAENYCEKIGKTKIKKNNVASSQAEATKKEKEEEKVTTPPTSPIDESKSSKFFKVSPAKAEELSDLEANGDVGSKNNTSQEDNLVESEMGQKLIADEVGNSNPHKYDPNPEDSPTISPLENSDLRDEVLETENTEDLNGEFNTDKLDETINLQEDSHLDFHGFEGDFEGGVEEEVEDYRTLLKNESPSLEKFRNLISAQELDLSLNEDSDNISPPAPQEDSKNSKISKEKVERVSRIISNKEQIILTRSRSACRYNDRPPVGQGNIVKKKPLKEKSCA